MSTSDPSSLILGGPVADQVQPVSNFDLITSGALSTDVISKLANELFSDAPAAPVSGGAPTEAPRELTSTPQFLAVPSEAKPEAASPVASKYEAAPLTVPGALAGQPSPATHDFSFLLEGRPIFGDAQLHGDDLSGATAPQEAEWHPVLPGSPHAPTSTSTPAEFSFLTELRPLGEGELADAIEPSAIEADVPQERDLHSYGFDAGAIKRDFPILRETVNGRPLVWLDNAATTQKPQAVIDRLTYFYEHENSNVHRAAHELAARATDAYEAAREKVRRFVNAPTTNEIIFVRGATEGINLIANTWGRKNIGKDDEIIITWLEHHANIVPWQILCAATGARLRVVPVDDSGQLRLDDYEKLLGPRTRLVSFTQVSNALGVITPAPEIIARAHQYGARVLLDGAQSVSHMRSDVLALDCDFFVFSGHKVFGPTGIGAVYGKPEVLEQTPPWQGGGNMIQDVTFEKTVFHGPPARFEAGTGNIADAVGLGAAIDYLDRVGMHNIAAHEHALLIHAKEELSRIPGLTIIGTAKEKAGVISFILDGYKTEEVGSHLNRNGIAVRSGHHCAQPILRRFGQESTVRASLALYNTHDDIERLVRAVWELRQGHTAIA